MFKIAFKLMVRFVVLWRRNDAISIGFKTGFLGGLLWLVARELGTAVLAHSVGIATATVALVHYTTKNRREFALLVKHLDGNERAARAMKKKLAGGGAGGALIQEMLRDSIKTEEAFEDIPELSIEDRETNRQSSRARLATILAMLDDQPGFEIPEREARIAELEQAFASGDGVAERDEILTGLLAERTISFCLEGFCDYDDHARIVECFAAATGGAWCPTGCTSSMDDEGENYTLRFFDPDGQEQKWRFHQHGDWLSESFLKTLIRHTERSSGLRVMVLQADEGFTAILLPAALHEALIAADGLH